ncbi:MAG TPA: amino acid ABC transporter substrate-binding protein [Burkholderiales bacterium]|nr:amino acid ABC transporter substrate-binding protein [Burkholderiales bacterium]
MTKSIFARPAFAAGIFARPACAAAIAALVAALGAGPAAARVEGDKIILGSAISITGKYSQEGKNAKDGYDFAVKRINDAGGVKVHGKTYKLEVKYYDDESTPARTAQLLERLINQDGIKFVLGPYGSGPTKAAAPVVEKYKIPMVEAEGASRSLFTQGYRYMFAALSTSEQYLSPVIELAAQLAEKHGRKPSDLKVAMSFENDPFSLDVRAGVLDEIKKYGMKVVVDDKMPRDLSDVSATLTKIKALKPDVILASGHTKGAITAARQMKEMSVNAPIVALTHCESADLTGKVGTASEGILCPTQWAETLKYKDPLFGTAMDYYKAFMKAHPEYNDVPYQVAQASAVIQIWADAFRRAQSFDTEKIRDTLAATDMDTFYGHVKFAPEGNNVGKPMVLRQIQDQKYVVVAPLKYAAEQVEFPRVVAQK